MDEIRDRMVAEEDTTTITDQAHSIIYSKGVQHNTMQRTMRHSCLLATLAITYNSHVIILEPTTWCRRRNQTGMDVTLFNPSMLLFMGTVIDNYLQRNQYKV
jgi:hypothetical protein